MLPWVAETAQPPGEKGSGGIQTAGNGEKAERRMADDGALQREAEEARKADAKSKLDALEALQARVTAHSSNLGKEQVMLVADVVHSTLKDSASPKAVQAALSCTTALVRAAPAVFRAHAAERLVPACIEKLGDAKQFVRSASKHLLMQVAALRDGTPHWLIERIEHEQCLRHKNWRVREETLSLCRDLLAPPNGINELPAGGVNAYLSQRSIALLDDTIASVRMAAMDMLVTLYSILGQPLRDALTRAQVRSTHMRELQSRFDSVDSASPSKPNDPATRQYTSFTNDYDDPEGLPTTKNRNPGTSAARGSGGVSSSSKESNDAVAAAAPSPQGEAITQVSGEQDASKKLADIVAQMAPEIEWDKRRNALWRFVELVGAAKGLGSFAHNLRGHAASALYTQLTDRRSAVAKDAAQALSECLKHLGRDGEYLLEGLNAVETLAGLAQQTVHVVAEAAEATLRTAVVECPSQRILRQVAATCKGHRSAKARIAAVRALDAAVDEWKDADLDTCAEQLREALVSGASDAGQDTRKAARHAINRLYERRQQLAESIISQLHPQHRRGLAQIDDSASSFNTSLSSSTNASVGKRPSLRKSLSEQGPRRRPSSASSLPAASRTSTGGDPKIEVVSHRSSAVSSESDDTPHEIDTDQAPHHADAEQQQHEQKESTTSEPSQNTSIEESAPVTADSAYNNDAQGQKSLLRSFSSPGSPGKTTAAGHRDDFVYSAHPEQEVQSTSSLGTSDGRGVHARADGVLQEEETAKENGGDGDDSSEEERILRRLIDCSRVHGTLSASLRESLSWTAKTEAIKAAERVCRTGDPALVEHHGLNILCAASDILGEANAHPRAVTAALELCNSVLTICSKDVIERANEHLVPALCGKLSDHRDSVKSLASQSLHLVATKSTTASLVPGILRALDLARPPRTRAAAMEFASHHIDTADALSHGAVRSVANKVMYSALEKQPQARAAAVALLASLLRVGGNVQAGCLDALTHATEDQLEMLKPSLEDHLAGASALVSSVVSHESPLHHSAHRSSTGASADNFVHSKHQHGQSQQQAAPSVQAEQQPSTKHKGTNASERRVRRAAESLRSGKSPEGGIQAATSEATQAVRDALHPHTRECAARVLTHAAHAVPPEAPHRLAESAALDEERVARASESALVAIVRGLEPIDAVKLLTQVIEGDVSGQGACMGAARYMRDAISRLAHDSSDTLLRELSSGKLLVVMLRMLDSDAAVVRFGAVESLAAAWYALGDRLTPLLTSRLNARVLRLITVYVERLNAREQNASSMHEDEAAAEPSPTVDKSAAAGSVASAAVASKSASSINRLQQRPMHSNRAQKESRATFYSPRAPAG